MSCLKLKYVYIKIFLRSLRALCRKERNLADTVYLLGAGASCQCVPTVQNFANQLLQDFNFHGGLGTVLQSNFTEEFNQFYPALTKHRSLDTFARLLFLQGKTTEYQSFKKFLDGYVSARSLFYDDLRYNSLLADLGVNSKGQIEYSSKISLFTWNYDFLLEKELLFANDIPNWNDIFSRVTHFNGVASGLIRIGNDESSLFKELKITYNDRFKNLQSYTLFVNKIIKSVKENISHIRFAWENSDEELDKIRADLTKKIQHATNVVIVGYTFPFYNRLVDEAFLHEMGQKNKIVLQDRDFSSAEALISQLELLNEHRGLKDIKKIVKSYENANSFYVPFDLDLKKL